MYNHFLVVLMNCFLVIFTNTVICCGQVYMDSANVLMAPLDLPPPVGFSSFKLINFMVRIKYYESKVIASASKFKILNDMASYTQYMIRYTRNKILILKWTRNSFGSRVQSLESSCGFHGCLIYVKIWITVSAFLWYVFLDFWQGFYGPFIVPSIKGFE